LSVDKSDELPKSALSSLMAQYFIFLKCIFKFISVLIVQNYSTTRLKFYLLLSVFSCSISSFSQTILDPCFLSPQLGMFESTPELGQVCRCFTDYEAADMLEWDGTQWLGRISYSRVDLAPPPGLNSEPFGLVIVQAGPHYTQ